MSVAQVRATALAGWEEQGCVFAGAAPAARDPCATIPLATFAQMTEQAGQRACAANASWLVGEGYDLAGLGEVGEAVLGAHSLGQALRRLSDGFELLQDSTHLGFAVSGDMATLSYRILDPAIWPRHQDALFSLGIMAQIIKQRVPEAAAFMELGFECARQETGLRVSNAQLSFDCDANFIRIPVSMLDVVAASPNPAADPRRLSQRLAERRRSLPASERLARIIHVRLPEGDLNQDELAREIGMSSRTMRRRLSDEATSFQQLLDDCRMRQAVLELRKRPDASIADIALRLGYAEHSTFTRAFTRWAGVPPSAYRADHLITRH